MDKARLKEAIIATLEAELATQVQAAHSSREEAIAEDNKAEDKYDMRSQSAAYLAAGQAKLATEIAEAIQAYRSLPVGPFTGPIATGALVTLKSGSRLFVVYVGPHRGGMEVSLDGTEVTVVTIASPLGRQLAGRNRGDNVTLPGRPKPVDYGVSSIE
jgi:transcription elongation GreA/GreB family factor